MPSRASLLAAARPIPLVPPVMSATGASVVMSNLLRSRSHRAVRSGRHPFSLGEGQQLHQFADLDLLQRTHGSFDFSAQSLVYARRDHLVEFRVDLLPGEWPR